MGLTFFLHELASEYVDPVRFFSTTYAGRSSQRVVRQYQSEGQRYLPGRGFLSVSRRSRVDIVLELFGNRRSAHGAPPARTVDPRGQRVEG